MDVPKSIAEKVDRANRMMDKIVRINMEVEAWLERNGVVDGYDFCADVRDCRGYEYDERGFFDKVDKLWR